MASFFGSIIDYLTGKSSSIDMRGIVSSNVKKNNFSSIASKASEGILQFPVIISNTIDYDTAVMVMKACERSYASFAKVVFSMNADMSDTGADNMSDYLGTFHQNTDSSLDSDPATLGNSFESFIIDKDPKYTYKCELFTPDKKIMSSRLTEELKPYIENFCLNSLNDMCQSRPLSLSGTTVNTEGFRPAKKSVVYTNKLRATTEAIVTADRTEKIFGDADVKKANELQPTFIRLAVTRIQKADGAEDSKTITYTVTIGIKATLHPVPSDEYISNLVDACEYKGTLFRFIRWTTGEIDFIRDFVLRMDLFAKETRNAANATSHWWNSLKKRAREAKISRVNSNRLLPNATFVISRTEADYIKANFGYDLFKDSLVEGIMREYFLLGIIIVDSASEICHVRYDGQKRYQVLTFKAMEREGGNAERQFKEMLRATKKM